ncbi:MAG: galactose mutarotase [Eubacteriales bacterium]|nr:galactose mutarotase [Eubacteriales bacterium]
MINKTTITDYNGKEVALFMLDNQNGLVAEIFNYGGIIKSLKVNGRDVVLGRNTFEDYLDNNGYLGAAIGRYGNRIQNSEFELNGKVYKLAKNDNENNLHGGNAGFDKKVWFADAIDADEPKLILKVESPDGEEGFPGNLLATITYTVTKNNSLKIEYTAQTDKDTIYNPTNHSYFNLDGHSSGAIYTQSVMINADFYTPNTDECIPCGEIRSVKDTPFDLNTKTKFSDVLHSDFEQIKKFEGFDHNFVLKGRGFRKIAEATSSDESITMETYTDLPGVQLYTANALEAGNYKEGATYGQHNAFCLETQFFPNSPNFSHFAAPIVKKDDKFYSVTEYKFIIK